MYIDTHIHICEKLFYQNIIFELGIGIANSFSGMALNAFWKRAVNIYLLFLTGESVP